MWQEKLDILDQSQQYETQLKSYDFIGKMRFTAEFTGNHFYIGKIVGLNRPIIVKFSILDGSAEREWQGITMAYRHNILTPKPIALVSRTEAPKIGFVTEYVQSKFPKANDAKHLAVLGNELRKLHSIALPGYGYISNSKPQFISAKSYLDFWLERCMPYIEKERSSSILFKHLLTVSSQRIYHLEPRFIHRDIKPDNIIEGYKTIKIIDFEWWQGGDPLDDLAVLLYHYIRLGKADSDFNRIVGYYFKDSGQINGVQRTSIYFYLILAAARVLNFCERKNPGMYKAAIDDFLKIVEYVKKIGI